MTDLILRIYDYLKRHRLSRHFSCWAFTFLLLLLVARLNYKEDIADFLPIDSEHSNALAVYQDIAGADKIFAIFQYQDATKADPDQLVEGIDRFVEVVQRRDTAHIVRNMMSQVDMESMSELTDFVYSNIPYFLTDTDYARFDTLLGRTDYVAGQLRQDKQLLMFPSGGILSDNIRRDPLNLFTPTVEKLQHSDSELTYEMYEGHIFSPDMQKAIVMMDSPFGSSETEHNEQLINMLQACADSVLASSDNMEIHIIGGPVIAVGNARQIKADSLLSVTISVVLILLLLFFTFRNFRNLFLIVLSIAWGWLFAMGGLALCHDRVSVIVIGISSIILGIAVNYPLHFIAHLSHTPDKRRALREIVMPLLVGNITTVGAFLTLVPLQSIALRDLGLFSSFLLMGTILFVLVYLPHLSTVGKPMNPTFLDRVSDVSLENKPIVVWTVVALTLLFGFFSLQTTFDSNMGHINYMTDEQQKDMEYFQQMMTSEGGSQKVYALSTDSTLDGALDKSLQLQPYLRELVQSEAILGYSGCTQFICSKAEQARRLALWQNFVAKYRDNIQDDLLEAGRSEGFSDDSFADFLSLFDETYTPQEVAYFDPLVRSLFASYMSCDSVGQKYNIVNILSVTDNQVKAVEEALRTHHCFSFDVASMNSAIANHLSDDFNYIGWTCGFIVFLFLWLSMGSIELAILSFVPMAVSWLWILGIMALFGMQFNIVNIILATFIFGQGDDYTIFMTEGASYEYAYRRKMLASYKHSIIISALIMFIGIGTLIVARHPALHSLAEVTIAGMFSVVLMAYIFPPLIFKFLVQSKNSYRIRPISLRPLLVKVGMSLLCLAQLTAVYTVGWVLFRLMSPTDGRKVWYRRFVQRICRYALHHIPTVNYLVENEHNETFDRPVAISIQPQSLLSVATLLALSPKIMVASTTLLSSHKLINAIFHWLGFVRLSTDHEQNRARLREVIEKGYSIALFSDEADRNDAASWSTLNVFSMAEQLGLDLMPLFVHGADMVFPTTTPCIYAGQIVVNIQPSVSLNDKGLNTGTTDNAQETDRFLLEAYTRLRDRLETPDYFLGFVSDRYRYKGTEVFRAVKSGLRRYRDFFDKMQEKQGDGPLVITNASYGELALLYALVHRNRELWVVETNEERRELLRYSAEGVAANLHVSETTDSEDYK